MRNILNLIAAAFVAALICMPSYATADGVKFSTLSNTLALSNTLEFTPIWIGDQPEGHLKWVRSGDEWFHIYPDHEKKRRYLRTFDWVGPFSEGLAPVRKDGREFHIRMDGSDAYEARYDAVGPFSNGYAPAVLDGNWFHIKPDGTRAYERNFSVVFGMSTTGHTRAIEKGTRYNFVIDMKGEHD